MVLYISLIVIMIWNSVASQTSLQQLQTCLGPLSTYLITSTYTYNTVNPYYSFSWLQTGFSNWYKIYFSNWYALFITSYNIGNRIRTIKIPIAVLMVQDITTVATAGNYSCLKDMWSIINNISKLCKNDWYSSSSPIWRPQFWGELFKLLSI